MPLVFPAALSIYLSISISIHLYIYLSIYLSIYIYIYIYRNEVDYSCQSVDSSLCGVTGGAHHQLALPVFICAPHSVHLDSLCTGVFAQIPHLTVDNEEPSLS